MLFKDDLSYMIDALLLAADSPITNKELTDFFDIDTDKLLIALNELKEKYQDNTLILTNTASGWRLKLNHNYSNVVEAFNRIKPKKLSPALLETISIIAYEQPVTRADIEEVRGVAVGSHIIGVLLSLNWIVKVGKKDVIGRPSLFSTTKYFLDDLGLTSLKDLPKLPDLNNDAIQQDILTAIS